MFPIKKGPEVIKSSHFILVGNNIKEIFLMHPQ